MRVAVVGAGIAGMSAAWALSSKHDVVLFEKKAVAGGHARTIDVACGNETRPVDIGFLIFHPWQYGNFLALLRHLRVATVPVVPGVDISAHFADGTHWRHGDSTPLKSRFQNEIERFHQFMTNISANPADAFGRTLGETLSSRGFSKEFQDKFVAPALSLLFITRSGALDIGHLAAAFCFGPASWSDLSKATSLETIQNGSREYVNKLIQEIDEVRLGCAVQGIERHRRGVNVRLEDQTTEAFDHVVLATDAQTSLRLLDRPSRNEQQLLGDVEYEPCKLVVHTDRSVMPRDESDWAAFTYMAAGCHPQATWTYSNYHLRCVQPWIEQDLFVTASPPTGLIDPQKVVHVNDGVKHIRCNTLQFLRAAEMYRIQGKRRTWHCGTHVAASAWHEGSLRTGLAVAVALGAVDYPFMDDPAAHLGFTDTGADLMRVLPKRVQSTIQESVWPPRIMRSSRRLLREVVLDEIRDKLRMGLGESWFGRFSPLRWARETAARCIAPMISPYQEEKKAVLAKANAQTEDSPTVDRTSQASADESKSESGRDILSGPHFHQKQTHSVQAVIDDDGIRPGRGE